MVDANVFDCFANSERAVKAISRIQSKKYESESWTILVKEAANKSIEDVESFYEEVIKIYPTCGRFWRSYIEHEMKSRRTEKVNKLFQRSLEDIICIDLYKCYLNHVKDVKANEPDLIYKAFRFTIERVGIDPNALSIYNDYIQFLKDRQVDGTYLEGQRITAVRRAYQEAIVIPMFNVENLWKDYLNFEYSLNSTIAERMSQERGKENTNARRITKEWEVTIRGLNRSWPATPPTFSPEELRQIEIWRRYINWEKSNPTRTENVGLITKRVGYAYKQFLLCFGHHPNVYHEYASYLDEQVRSLNDKEAELTKRLIREETTLFDKATKGLMKNNLLIHFSYADFEEARNDRKKALEIYNNLIESCRKDNNSNDLTLIYIQLMRFTRRIEGLRPARVVFKRARDEKDPSCSHQVYTAAALMEYHCTKDHSIACKIFELGLKKFATISDYILTYIHFMSSLNEENNTRVLFERVLTTCSLEPKDTVEIWNSFLEFEAAIGDLASINKVERRRSIALEQLFPRCSDSSWSIDKYKFQDLFPCSVTELRSLGYDPQLCATSSTGLRNLLTSLGHQAGIGGGQQVNNSALQTTTCNKSKVNNKNRNRPDKTTNGNAMMDAGDQGEGADFSISMLNQDNSMCLPDLDQMLPFKPVMAPGFGAHTVPGGVFPPPPAVGNLLSRLPQSSSFWGPFVDIDELCNIIKSTDFDELFNQLVEQRRESNKPRTKKPRLD